MVRWESQWCNWTQVGAYCRWGNQQCGGRSWLPIASGVTGNMAESFKTLITLGFGNGSHLVNVGC